MYTGLGFAKPVKEFDSFCSTENLRETKTFI